MRTNRLYLKFCGAIAAFLSVVLFDIQIALASPSVAVQCAAVLSDSTTLSEKEQNIRDYFASYAYKAQVTRDKMGSSQESAEQRLRHYFENQQPAKMEKPNITSDEIAAVMAIAVNAPAETPKFLRTKIVGLEVMSNPVNQAFWQKVADLVNPHVTSTTKINPWPSQARDDHASVESITHAEANKWVRALNWLAKIKHPALKEIIPDHWNGDTYRLPTDTEWSEVRAQDSSSLALWVESKARFAMSADSRVKAFANTKSSSIGLILVRERSGYAQ